MGWFGKHRFAYSGAGFGRSALRIRRPGSGIGMMNRVGRIFLRWRKNAARAGLFQILRTLHVHQPGLAQLVAHAIDVEA